MPLLTILVSIAGLVLELFILNGILSHPAGGWPLHSWLNLAANGGLTSLPYVALTAWWLWSIRNREVMVRILKISIFMALTGGGFAALGLTQYGHATPVFLVIGFVGQWVILIVGFFLPRHLRNGSKGRRAHSLKGQ